MKLEQIFFVKEAVTFILRKQDILVKEDEREIYRRILNEDINLFKIFANSFLIEISDESIKNDIAV